jgi:L-cysteine:1D-myo-inositol 2-amino-2-deoxy-alpha-D-glucopyranoside ligase
MLSLYDTGRARRAVFRPRRGTVTLYVCGVTPYDTTHLGHARTFLVFDVLVRHLEATGRPVRYVQNVTDIDESILQRAARDRVGWRALGRHHERGFLADMAALGWREPDVMPHATRELPAMVALIRRLLRARHAYRLPGGGVYYDVSRFPRYGALSRLPPTRMRRLLAAQDDAKLDDPRRLHPLDFALWRRVSGPPTFSSPFGRGRPGWHLECSAMAHHHLGVPVDIHGGGADLVFPHHEAEIAQSEAAWGRPFVRWWVHVAPMRLGGEKMSKSTGNMIFVRDALRETHPDGLRLYLLAEHYRRPFDHDPRRMAEADALALAIRRLAARAGTRAAAAPVPRAALRMIDRDLDTPAVLRLLQTLTRAGDPAAVAVARHLGVRVGGSRGAPPGGARRSPADRDGAG